MWTMFSKEAVLRKLKFSSLPSCVDTRLVHDNFLNGTRCFGSVNYLNSHETELGFYQDSYFREKSVRGSPEFSALSKLNRFSGAFRGYATATEAFVSTSEEEMDDTSSLIINRLFKNGSCYRKGFVGSIGRDPGFRNLVSGLGPSEIDEILGRLLNKNLEAVLDFFYLMKNNYFLKHSRVSYMVIARVLAILKRPRALNLHLRELVQHEGSGSAPLLCELLSSDFGVQDAGPMALDILAFAYSRLKMVHDALFVVSKMKQLNLLTSIVTFNSLLANLRATVRSLCKSGHVGESLDLLSKMKNAGLEPDHVIYSILIQGFCEQGQVCRALQLLEETCLKRINLGSLTHRVSLMSLCRIEPVSISRMYFDTLIAGDLVQDIFLFNIMINRYAKLGNTREAVALYKLVLAKGISPNIVTFNSLIYSFCKIRKQDEAIKWLKTAEANGFEPSVVTYTTLFNMFCENRNGQAMSELLNMMLARAIEPTLVTYTVHIKRLCMQGKLDESICFLRKMRLKGLTPDLTSYNIIIQYLCKLQYFKLAIQLHNEMLQDNIQPDHVTYNILISGLCKYGYLWDADKLFHLLVKLNVQLGKVSYTSLIKAHCIKGDVHKAFNHFCDMVETGYDISIRDCSAVINRLCKRHLIHYAKDFLRIVLFYGISIDKQICLEMWDALYQTEDFVSMSQLKSLMVKCGIILVEAV